MPIQDVVVLGYLEASVHRQPDNIIEVLLAQRYLVGVDVCALERSEEQLAGCCFVGVGAGHHDRYIQPLQHLEGALTPMVTGSVPAEHSAISPVLVLFVQLLDQMLDEEGHDTLVAVGLGQRQIYVAQLVHACDHADPGLQLLPLN